MRVTSTLNRARTRKTRGYGRFPACTRFVRDRAGLRCLTCATVNSRVGVTRDKKKTERKRNSPKNADKKPSRPIDAAVVMTIMFYAPRPFAKYAQDATPGDVMIGFKTTVKSDYLLVFIYLVFFRFRQQYLYRTVEETMRSSCRPRTLPGKCPLRCTAHKRRTLSL